MRHLFRCLLPPWKPAGTILGLFAISVPLTLGWLLVGSLLAAYEGVLLEFVRDFALAQIPFAVLAAFFLGLLSMSDVLIERYRDLRGGSEGPAPGAFSKGPLRRMKYVVILLVFLVGTGSTVQLRFIEVRLINYYYWATCSLVCFFAGYVTWHALEIISIFRSITRVEVKLYAYSPADTHELKRLAEYVTTFSVATTAGYVFSLVGTIIGPWTGPEQCLRFVRLFWPAIYVPICLSILTYPHAMIHRLIRHSKDRIISFYQTDINRVLQPGLPLEEAQISRINSLASLLNRIEGTPNFAVNARIASGIIGTYAVNLASLMLPKDLLREAILRCLEKI